MFTRIFVHSNGLGGVVQGGGEDLKKRLDQGPEKASVKGGNSQSCTLGCLFTRTALEEPITTAERVDPGLMSATILFTIDGPGGAVVEARGESPGRNASVRGSSVVEETEGRDGSNS
jgi:hypothetical protein